MPTDKAYVCQGFPLDPATGQIPPDSDLPLLPSESSFLLQGRCIPFDNDNRDWPYRNGPPQPTTLDISADNTKDVYRCFVTATKELNDAKIVYALLGYNSNSYVRAILDKCIVPGGRLKDSCATGTGSWMVAWCESHKWFESKPFSEP
ncbi:MAG: hypothetical protein QOK68_01865 [Nitrososphaeraceae archaeon]|nr:hypothetical protein [Nitrososphaeraceae archaeon]